MKRPLHRGKRLKPESKRRRAARIVAESVRQEYRWEFGKCQHPGCRNDATDIHEICSGKGRRQCAIGERALLLSLCRWCHAGVQFLPHDLQLAIKKRVDPVGYDLEVYRRVMRGKDGRQDAVILTEADIEQAANRLAELFG